MLFALCGRAAVVERICGGLWLAALIRLLAGFAKEAFDGSVALFLGFCEDGLKKLFLGVGHFDVAAVHDIAGGADRAFEGHAFHQVAVPDSAEGGNVLRQEFSIGKDQTHDSDRRAGVDQTADRGFCVIADEAADFQFFGVDQRSANRHGDGRIVVLQVAVGRQGSDVHPGTDIAAAEEAVVILVHIAMQDGRGDLPTDLADGADGRALPNVRSEQMSASRDVTRSFQSSERLNDTIGLNTDGAFRGIDHDERIDLHRRIDVDSLGIAHETDLRAQTIRVGGAELTCRKVSGDLFSIVTDDIPRIAGQDARRGDSTTIACDFLQDDIDIVF